MSDTLDELRRMLSNALQTANRMEVELKEKDESDPFISAITCGSLLILAKQIASMSKDETDEANANRLEEVFRATRDQMAAKSFIGFDGFLRKVIGESLDKFASFDDDMMALLAYSELAGLGRCLAMMTGQDSDIRLSETVNALCKMAYIKLQGGPSSAGGGPVTLN